MNEPIPEKPNSAVHRIKVKNTFLTPREFSVFEMVIIGKMDKEIAVDINISESTVKYHLDRIFDKFNVRSRRDLVALFGHFECVPVWVPTE